MLPLESTLLITSALEGYVCRSPSLRAVGGPAPPDESTQQSDDAFIGGDTGRNNADPVGDSSYSGTLSDNAPSACTPGSAQEAGEDVIITSWILLKISDLICFEQTNIHHSQVQPRQRQLSVAQFYHHANSERRASAPSHLSQRPSPSGPREAQPLRSSQTRTARPSHSQAKTAASRSNRSSCAATKRPKATGSTATQRKRPKRYIATAVLGELSDQAEARRVSNSERFLKLQLESAKEKKVLRARGTHQAHQKIERLVRSSDEKVSQMQQRNFDLQEKLEATRTENMKLELKINRREALLAVHPVEYLR
ncbi:unnamed protein product [Phytophthora fragariaefolia]|uniref:Unnamed protein product n=1 Tax=Phytophthora fragariaefolia TaxID=1490495 RepID=A0A9W6WW10_9STRA|nr:unnamed protein product [Phytophthora fragariaefolia]